MRVLFVYGGINVKNFFKSQLIIIAGIALTAAATGLFYLPNEIVTGGVSGIATILYRIGIPPGAVYLILNVILLGISYRRLGKRFVINSVISVAILSVLVQFLSTLPPVTSDLFLASFFGSCLFGAGAATVLASGSNTGGTDIIGRLIQSRCPYFPIGTLLLAIDGIIILISLFVFRNIELALYGLFGLIVSSVIINFMIDRLNASKLAFVITDKSERISKLILENSRRGVTVLNARGAYSGARKNLLICALKNRQMSDFHKMIKSADKDAFIIFTKSEKIFGSGFYVYK